MPFLGYIHAREPDEPDRHRPPWEPSWHVWRWLLAAAVAVFVMTLVEGALEALLALVAFGLCCRAAFEAVPDGDGLRGWRQ